MKYPIYKPYLNEKTKLYVDDCIDSTWISSKGKYVDIFEKSIAKYCERKFSVSVFNGTVALHLALMALGIGDGDQVILPDFTYIATANAVKYVGATPIFADVSMKDWNITLSEIKRLYTKNVKAIIIVDIYGTQPCELDKIREYANEKDLFIIQDSAESLGSLFNSYHVGEFADVATLSFFGNKTITTGEGGMVLTDDEELYNKMQVLKNQGNSPTTRYYHDTLGYNFRMTNIQAAIGCSQIEIIDEILTKKQYILDTYKKILDNYVIFQNVSENIKSSNWLVSVIIEEKLENVCNDLEIAGVETRPFFYPASSMPYYTTADNKNSYYLSKHGISLPSYPELNTEDIVYICDIIKKSIGENI